MTSDLDRIAVVTSLIGLDEPISDVVRKLAQFPWDYDGVPVILTRANVENVLKRFLDNRISSSDVEAWSDAIELRDDIDYNEVDYEWIVQAIFVLATPSINGPIDREAIIKLLDSR